jgi:hypothetical protein
VSPVLAALAERRLLLLLFLLRVRILRFEPRLAAGACSASGLWFIGDADDCGACCEDVREGMLTPADLVSASSGDKVVVAGLASVVVDDAGWTVAMSEVPSTPTESALLEEVVAMRVAPKGSSCIPGAEGAVALMWGDYGLVVAGRSRCVCTVKGDSKPWTMSDTWS